MKILWKIKNHNECSDKIIENTEKFKWYLKIFNQFARETSERKTELKVYGDIYIATWEPKHISCL